VWLRPKKANSLPSPRQGQAPWGGLTASLDMEPRASRFDWPGAATYGFALSVIVHRDSVFGYR